MLFGFRALLADHAARLAALITAEHGKTLADARGEMQRGLEVVEFACGIPHLLAGEYTENVATGVDAFSQRQPLGVCAGISPFNFPAMVPMWMFPIALACGNTFVMKPSEKDPSLATELALLARASRTPAGVFNVVNGDAQTVDALLAHPDLGGDLVRRLDAGRGARLSHRDAGRQARAGARRREEPPGRDARRGRRAGGRRADRRGLRQRGRTLHGDLGRCRRRRRDGRRPDRGATATARDAARRTGRRGRRRDGPADHRRNTASACARTSISASTEGADLVVDGRAQRFDGDGFFLGASLFDRVTPAMRIYREEIFGPVLVVVRARSFDEALGIVDAHPFGNGAAIFTRDGGVAREFNYRVRAGMVGINVPIPVPMAFHSFGGWKRSLFGDVYVHGMEGVRFYTRLKTTTARWPSGPARGADFNIPATH